MNVNILVGGGTISFLLGIVATYFAPASASPYVSAGIVLVTVGLAIKFK